MPKTASQNVEEYSTVKVPKGLVEEIDKMMDKHGFRSRSEFVKEAVRSLLREYGAYRLEEEESPLNVSSKT